MNTITFELITHRCVCARIGQLHQRILCTSTHLHSW